MKQHSAEIDTRHFGYYCECTMLGIQGMGQPLKQNTPEIDTRHFRYYFEGTQNFLAVKNKKYKAKQHTANIHVYCVVSVIRYF